MISWASFVHPTAEDRQKDNSIPISEGRFPFSQEEDGDRSSTSAPDRRTEQEESTSVERKGGESTQGDLSSRCDSGEKGVSAGKWNAFLMKVAASRKPDSVFLLDSEEKELPKKR